MRGGSAPGGEGRKGEGGGREEEGRRRGTTSILPFRPLLLVRPLPPPFPLPPSPPSHLCAPPPPLTCVCPPPHTHRCPSPVPPPPSHPPHTPVRVPSHDSGRPHCLVQLQVQKVPQGEVGHAPEAGQPLLQVQQQRPGVYRHKVNEELAGDLRKGGGRRKRKMSGGGRMSVPPQ